MTPAQRHRRLRVYKKKKNKKYTGSRKIFLVSGFLLLVVLSLVVFCKRSYLPSLKNSMVVAKRNGDIYVSVFDPSLKEISSIYIPANTQLVVSRQLGTWKAKSIWQLGINEGYHGQLLQETIVKNFHFPVTIWADENAYGLMGSNLVNIFKAFSPFYKSNLSFSDKLHLVLISLGAENEKRVSWDLVEAGILKLARLVDGEDGFVISKKPPTVINAIFAEDVSSETGGLKTIIVNNSKNRGISEEVGETIANMGAKVMSIKEEDSQEYDCLVSGREKEFVKKLIQIYSCKQEDFQEDLGFDLIVRLGEGFVRRY